MQSELNNPPIQGLPICQFSTTYTFKSMGTLTIFHTNQLHCCKKKIFYVSKFNIDELSWADRCMLWQKPAQSNAKSHVSFKLLPSITLTLSALFCKIKSKLVRRHFCSTASWSDALFVCLQIVGASRNCLFTICWR